MKKNIILGLVAVVCFFSFGSSVIAQDWQPVSTNKPAPNQSLIKSYRNYAVVSPLKMPVPGIVEADFSLSEVYSDLVAVHNEETKEFVAYEIVNTYDKNINVTKSIDSVSSKSLSSLFDSNYDTVVDFNIDNSGAMGRAYLQVSFSEPIKSTTLVLTLGEYVSLPASVTVKAVVNNSEVIVLSRLSPSSSRINFPETTSKDWTVELTYSQPLRISELSFNNLLNTATKKTVRFLGLPNNTYVVYVNPENSLRDDANSLNNLATVNGSTSFKKLGMFGVVDNPSFVLSDRDQDTIPDLRDNCVLISNLDQIDLDQNGRGDVCDDFDADLIMNISDNCVQVVNRNQLDTDGDGVGDLCDTDESRLTEKYPFIVWFGIGFAGMVLLGLLFITGNKIRKNNENNIPTPPIEPPLLP